MKLALFALVAAGCLIAAVKSLEEEYDYEEEAAAPITPAPARSNSPRLGGLLSSRGRTNAARKTPTAAAAATQSTTAKAVEQPAEADEEADEEYEENAEQQEETPTTTTESSKKVRGGIRPFRSNQDLLAALKRRRAQAGASNGNRESTGSQTATESSATKSKTTSNGRNKSSGGGGGGGGGEAKSSGRGRFGASRGNKPVQEEVEETQREEVQVKPKPYRRG